MAAGGEVLAYGWTEYFQELGRFLECLERQYGIANEYFTDYAIQRINSSLLSLSHIQDIITGNSIDDSLQDYEVMIGDLLDILSSLQSSWIMYQATIESTSHLLQYRAPVVHTGERGRPKFLISKGQLEYLRSLSFTWSDIGSLLAVSRMTIYRRRQECGLLEEEPPNMITDDNLILLLRDLKRELPYMGESLISGSIRGMGYQVTRSQLRRCIRRIDPLSIPLRWGGSTQTRRPYSVPGPNSLWHLDGHHKLIRWGFVTHGCIDGYSRMIVYLQCNTNNRAATVLTAFISASQKYGLPSRVRCDYGKENYDVARHMLQYRGLHRNSVITGSSTHNQRIERLWCDVHRSVTKMYYRLFYFLEHQALLDPLKELHLFSLQYVYLPRINRALDIFREGWNNHGIRTAHHLSPRQLFVSGALRLYESGLLALDFFDKVDDMYGTGGDINEDDIPSDDSSEVTIPLPRVSLTPDHMEMLRAQVDPLSHSDNFAIELYERTIQLCQNWHAF